MIGGAACLEEIRKHFGDRVAGIVSDCTADVEPKPPWRDRKEPYIASLDHKPKDSLLVSLADKTHNVRANLDALIVHGPALWQRFTGGRDGSLWYYDQLAHAFLRLLPGPAADRLAFVVQEMHRAA